MDNILITVSQITEAFRVSPGAVRAWIAAGRLAPIRRAGRGRGGTMLFSRGAVCALVFGSCKTCGNGFKRSTLKQECCSRLCRDRFRRNSRRK
jgi:hypothetical protein